MKKNIFVLMMAAATLASCIDEDRSGCGDGASGDGGGGDTPQVVTNDYAIKYTVRLHTNMETELSTELTTADELAYAERLRAALGDVFTDWARDVDLNFFTGSTLAQHFTRQMDAATKDFTLLLPVADYRHLAIANVAEEPLVSTTGGDALTSLSLVQATADTIASQSIGLFSARLPMLVEDGIDQTFHVDLYMQNCACAVVIDTNNVATTALRGYVEGMASSFAVSDSLYSYANTVPVTMKECSDDNFKGFYAASFPSPDEPNGDGYYWAVVLDVTLADGTMTRNTLKVEKPLRAGNLKILKVKLNPNGSFEPMTQDLGISVQVDWHPGGSHEVEI